MTQRGKPIPSPQSPQPFDYAAQWLDEPEAEELTLPSGRRVLVRKPDLLDFIRLEGSRIPDPLAPIVYRFIGERDGDDRAAGEENSPLDTMLEQGTAHAERVAAEKLKRQAEDAMYLDVIVVAAVVEPRLALGEPGPGEIAVSRLDRRDRMHIWRWAEGIATPLLAGFPEDAGEAGGTVPAVGDGEGLSPATEPTGASDAAG